MMVSRSGLPRVPPLHCFCKMMILMGLPSTITKKLFILKELGVFWGCVFRDFWGGTKTSSNLAAPHAFQG